MTNEQVWLAITGALALVSLLVSVLARRRAARSEARVEELSARLASIDSPDSSLSPHSSPSSVSSAPVSTYVITDVEQSTIEQSTPVPPTSHRIEGRLFADIVAREAVVKAAAWTHGVRRALAAETRNRIRFEMRQETRRAGRERRAEMKVALREHRARSRADIEEDVA